MLFHRQALSNLRGGPGQRRASHNVQQVMDPAVAAIVDRGNWDGVCVALLVKEMLVSHLLTALEQVSDVLTEEDSLPPETGSALIICTNGCFHSASFVRQVLEAKEMGAHFEPVMAEENFHFPTETFHKGGARECADRLGVTEPSLHTGGSHQGKLGDRHREHLLGDRHRRGAARFGGYHCARHGHCRKTPGNQKQQATSQFEEVLTAWDCLESPSRPVPLRVQIRAKTFQHLWRPPPLRTSIVCTRAPRSTKPPHQWALLQCHPLNRGRRMQTPERRREIGSILRRKSVRAIDRVVLFLLLEIGCGAFSPAQTNVGETTCRPHTHTPRHTPPHTPPHTSPQTHPSTLTLTETDLVTGATRSDRRTGRPKQLHARAVYLRLH